MRLGDSRGGSSGDKRWGGGGEGEREREARKIQTQTDRQRHRHRDTDRKILVNYFELNSCSRSGESG